MSCHCCLAVPLCAEPLEITRDYSYLDMSLAARDQACLVAFVEHVAPRFIGLHGVSLPGHIWFETASGGAGVYSGATFLAEGAEARGALVCIHGSDGGDGSDGITVTDVSVSFSDRGLPAPMKPWLANDDPDQRLVTRTSFAARVTQP